MVWGTLFIAGIVFTIISFKYYNLLLSFVGMIVWLALWTFNLDNHPTAIVDGTFTYEALYYVFIIMAIVTMLLYFRSRSKRTNMPNGIDAEYQDTSKPTIQSARLMDKSLDEYRQYIRTRSGNKRR
jgi:uncharacterized membrane protein